LAAISPNTRLVLYVLANLGFVLLMGIAYGVAGCPNPRFLYLALLFSLCSSPIIYLDSLNGRYSLLSIFLAAYFLLMGTGNVSELLTGAINEKSTAVLSVPEMAILLGGFVLVLGYRSIVSLHGIAAPLTARRDWSRSAVFLGGAIMWGLGTFATYEWYVHIVTDSTNEATIKGLENAGIWNVSVSILAQMMQPLGILMIAYAWRTYRVPALFAAVIAVVTLQVLLGFVADAKGLAMMGGILVMMAIILIDARIPKLWLIGAVIYAILIFPIFQAYRTEIHGNRGISRAAVVENFGRILDLTLSAETRVNTGSHRAQTLLERSSAIGSVQMIFEKAGNGVAFQHGYTLTPLLATFIPKVVWPDKPDVPTGQLVNKEFHVTDGEDVYISPTNLGELYWNFGWPGVVLGMTTIGAILGWVGSRFNMADARTVTRLLVTVVTIKEVVMGFEGVIAASYVVWLRSLAGIGLLHLMFARIPVPWRGGSDTAPATPTVGELVTKPYPNVLA